MFEKQSWCFEEKKAAIKNKQAYQDEGDPGHFFHQYDDCSGDEREQKIDVKNNKHQNGASCRKQFFHNFPPFYFGSDPYMGSFSFSTSFTDLCREQSLFLTNGIKNGAHKKRPSWKSYAAFPILIGSQWLFAPFPVDSGKDQLWNSQCYGQRQPHFRQIVHLETGNQNDSCYIEHKSLKKTLYDKMQIFFFYCTEKVKNKKQYRHSNKYCKHFFLLFFYGVCW